MAAVPQVRVAKVDEPEAPGRLKPFGPQHLAIGNGDHPDMRIHNLIGGIQQRIEEFEKSLDKASQRFFANEAARLGLPVAELLVGEACSLGGINKASSLNALRKAAESVEKRQQYLRSIAEVPDHPEKIVDEISEAERQSKRRVYEAMLNDCLSDIAPPALRT